MITKEKLKQTIELIIELNGSLTLSYVPSSDLKNPKGPYGWYYGGSNKIEISREFYRAVVQWMTSVPCSACDLKG